MPVKKQMSDVKEDKKVVRGRGTKKAQALESAQEPAPDVEAVAEENTVSDAIEVPQPTKVATAVSSEVSSELPNKAPSYGARQTNNGYYQRYNQGSGNGYGYSRQNAAQTGGSRTNIRRGASSGNGYNSRNDRSRYNDGNGNNGGNVDPTTYTGDVIAISGILEVLQDYGVIRQDSHPYDNQDLPKDIYISQSQIRRFSLRPGDLIAGFARPPKEGERYLSLLKVDKVEDMDPEEAKKRPKFTKLTPIFPNEWLKLETEPSILSTRLIDLVAPIGRGQRAMVVAPPKAGKTWLLRDIANGITTNYPEIVLLVALIGERPEEVTHFARSVKGEVFSSNFDEKADEQTRIAEICLERAKRMAEQGKDVVILMDSLTRIARAYNMVAPPSGRTLTGGFDPAALYPAKHFFGAARKLEEGGSLTIIATALVDTGSRMDDVIFEEFKGTGNMELRLDRVLAERRIFPAIDIKASGTRHEEYLLDKDSMEKIFRLRRMMDLLEDRDVTELVLERLKKSKSNQEFLENLHKAQ